MFLFYFLRVIREQDNNFIISGGQGEGSIYFIDNEFME